MRGAEGCRLSNEASDHLIKPHTHSCPLSCPWSTSKKPKMFFKSCFENLCPKVPFFYSVFRRTFFLIIFVHFTASPQSLCVHWLCFYPFQPCYLKAAYFPKWRILNFSIDIKIILPLLPSTLLIIVITKQKELDWNFQDFFLIWKDSLWND